jgi:hypothetical protein
VAFVEWTPDGHLRQSRFVGVRAGPSGDAVMLSG